MTDLASIEFNALLDQLRAYHVDPVLLEQVANLHVYEVAAQRDRAQVEVLTIGEKMEKHLDRMESKLSSDIKAQLGSTNTMIGDLNASMIALRDMFLLFGERLTSVESTIAEHTIDIASFKRSREQSVSDRLRLENGRLQNAAAIAELGTAITEVRDEARAYGTASRKHYDELANQVERLSGMVQTVLPILGEVPADRLAKLAEMIKNHERMLRDEYNIALENDADGDKS